MTKTVIPVFQSVFSSILYDFVNFKRMEGYKYNSEVKELQRFDKYLHSLTQDSFEISEELIYPWLSRRSSESDKTFSTRNSVYRQLYRYSSKLEEYKLPKPPYAIERLQSNSFTPYIFTHNQIKELFAAADTDNTASQKFQLYAPLLFRLLYGTGLRVNEALSLLVSDVNINSGLILIRDGKNDNSRLIPLARSLCQRMNKFIKICRYTEDEPLFQNSNQDSLGIKTVYEWYRRILWKAGIPHKGRGKGPRLHDIRHTFAVHSLQQAISQGMDINAYLPLLCTYLGHKRLSATERYLRLTAEAYPSVMMEINGIMNPIIPEVNDYEG